MVMICDSDDSMMVTMVMTVMTVLHHPHRHPQYMSNRISAVMHGYTHPLVYINTHRTYRDACV